MSRRNRKEVLSPSEKFSKAENNHAKAWWWQKTKTLKELETAGTLLIDSPTTLEQAKWHHERMLRHELLSHLAPRAYACWMIFSTQEVLGANRESCIRIFYEAAPELREQAFSKVLMYADTVKAAKTAHYAAGDKEPAMQAQALEMWRELSDHAVSSATGYYDTVTAMEDIPYRDGARVKQAIELALERCANAQEVIQWLGRFATARNDKAGQEAGARKLLQFAETADPVSA